jgi:asparagine synthase (glutamine-hydrolysing)
VDSSAIVALMAQVGTEPVKTYSIGYSGDSVAKYYNELDYARAMAHRVGSAHREIVVRPNVAELLPKLIWHLEEPISDTAILTTYLVSVFAAQDVKVIMSGVGGDELFGGYPRYLGDIYGSRYRRLPSWIRNGLVRPLVERLPSSRSSRILDLARYAKEFVRADELDWEARYKSYVRLERFDVLSSLMIEPPAATDGFDSLAEGVRATDPLLRLVSLDLRTQLPEALLLLSDKMTMATSIECRVPFLDHKLIELAARAPQHVKLPNGRLKGLLKLALVDVLPVEVLQRKKRGFGAPMGAWLKRDLLGLRSALLSPSAVERRGLLRSDGVREVCASHDSGVADYTDLLVVLMNLELWFRIFVDNVAPDDVAGELAERMEAA